MAENIYNSELFKIRHWPLTILIIISLAVVIFLFYLPGLVDKTDKCTMGNAFYYTALLLLLAGILFVWVFSHNKYIQYKRHMLDWEINKWREGLEDQRQKEQRKNVLDMRKSDREQRDIQNFFRLAELSVSEAKKLGQYKADDGKVHEAEIEYRKQLDDKKFTQLWEKYEALIKSQESQTK